MTQTKKQLNSFLTGTAMLAVLWMVRIVFTHTISFTFLFWNLILAWVPFAITRYMLAQGKMSSLKWEACFVAWLLFLPNAPYIVTDLVHLKHRDGVPIWFDAVMIFTAALSGLWIGCISLLQMETLWRKQFPKVKTVYFTAVTLLLCGFGIYLGRVLRFNSWDIITDPISLLQVIAHCVVYPWHNLSAWMITLLFAGLMWVALLQVRNLDGEIGTSNT